MCMEGWRRVRGHEFDSRCPGSGGCEDVAGGSVPVPVGQKKRDALESRGMRHFSTVPYSRARIWCFHLSRASPKMRSRLRRDRKTFCPFLKRFGSGQATWFEDHFRTGPKRTVQDMRAQLWDVYVAPQAAAGVVPCDGPHVRA